MVYIVILHWNNFRCTDFCLSSLQNITYKNYKIILVDNFSTDDSLNKLKDKYPNLIYLYNKENIGFARGSNVGMQYAYENGAEYIILLNNDVEVSPDFIQNIIEPTISDDNIGLVTPKIYYRENKKLIWHAGGYINHKTISGISRGYDEIDIGQFDNIIETKWASGACCLVTRKLIEKIGYLEEKYFFGQEEWDYSTTAINAGFKIIYTPKSIVYHEIGQSSTKSPALYAYQNVYNKYVYAYKFLPTLNFYYWALKYFIYIILFFPKKNLPNDKVDQFYMKTAKKAAIWGIKDFFFMKKNIDSTRILTVNNKLKKIKIIN